MFPDHLPGFDIPQRIQESLFLPHSIRAGHFRGGHLTEAEPLALDVIASHEQVARDPRLICPF
ncbi:MAG: hypothetical protein NTNFB02_31540 [Nitrospira sp.]